MKATPPFYTTLEQCASGWKMNLYVYSLSVCEIRARLFDPAHQILDVGREVLVIHLEDVTSSQLLCSLRQ